MSLVKIGPKHQITIPKEVFSALNLEAGDYVEIEAREGKGIINPKRVVEKAPAPSLSVREQSFLKIVRAKILAINKDLSSAKGLTNQEIDLAVKVGLIDENQKWWWSEEWQSHERKAAQDIKENKLSETYSKADDLIFHLRNQ